MKANPHHVSTCSNCRFFQPEGHDRGICDRLHSRVRDDWQACHLALPTSVPMNAIPLDLDDSIERENSTLKKFFDRLRKSVYNDRA